jgi:hypothetical protein
VGLLNHQLKLVARADRLKPVKMQRCPWTARYPAKERTALYPAKEQASHQGRLQPTGSCHHLQVVGMGFSIQNQPASAGLLSI